MPEDTRTITVGQKAPTDARTRHLKPTITNKIKTSKYTLWNFLPKNLFEQFRRFANFYFLCIALVQYFITAPVSPLTSLIPLIFVVTVTAIKQGYEDTLRHMSDNVTNNILVKVVQNGELVETKSQDITVGDILKIHTDDEIPCDAVLLSSSNEDGDCLITTANLDGESSLKIYESPATTKKYQTPQDFKNLAFTIECEPPVSDLYTFNGRLTVIEEKNFYVSGLTASNLLLKGSRLKNTAFVYGCAVYVGQDSKMFLNLKLRSNKFSTVEKSSNEYLVALVVVLLTEAFLLMMLKYIYQLHSVADAEWYLPHFEKTKFQSTVYDFLSFLILFNYIIPISLYVTLEMVKFIGSKFLTWDEELFDKDTNERPRCHSSDLNEELGQVKYLFSDKTGTITENDMQFRECSIKGVRYIDHHGVFSTYSVTSAPEPLLMETLLENNPEVEEFFTALVLCNTVQILKAENKQKSNSSDNGKLEYQASSPDEKALIDACKKYGVVLLSQTKEAIQVRFGKKLRQFRKLHYLYFDSYRKRMSVLIENENAEVILYCKGADSALAKISTAGPKQETLCHVNEYAMAGLRTLVFAYKKITRKQYEVYKRQLTTAEKKLKNRKENLSTIYHKIESKLTILGATAVEDRLQENVVQTLDALKLAGIKIWILTGDKFEAAINISYSSGHFSPDMCLLELTDVNPTDCENKLNLMKNRIENEPLERYALVMDGVSLNHAMHHEELLFKVACKCSSVVCCRMSPLQKANIIKMVKCSEHKPVTAAIGDGANDVSMIQQADVGLGIIGKEGRQAANCSDFAFSKFKYLQRIFLVHGHYYYIRLATLVAYSLYKNIVFITPQVYFCFCTAFTAQPLYHEVFLMAYNIVFTSFPILFFGLIEQHIPKETLLSNPHLYRTIANNAHLTSWQFAKWMIMGIWHSVVIFVGILMMEKNGSSLLSGETFDLMTFGTVAFHVLIIIVNLKIALYSHYWTVPFIGAVIFSITGFIIFMLLFSSIPWSLNTYYGAALILVSSGNFWLITSLLIVIALIPDVTIQVIENSALYSLLKAQKYTIRARWSVADEERRYLLT